MAFWNRDKSTPAGTPTPAPPASSHVGHSHSHAAPAQAAASSGIGLSQVRYSIAIASGKGGVGKSTVANNLGMALRYTGATVGLMDADIYGPSQPGMLGAVGQRPGSTDNSLIPIQKHGVKFMSMGSLTGGEGPLIWRAPMAMKIIHQFIENVEWGALDYLLIDLPPGTGDVQLTLAQQARLAGAVIVTTPQEVALGIAKKGLQMFEQVKVPILGIIENMSGFECKHCGKETAIFKEGGGERLARELGVPFLGAIPLDPEVMMSGDEGIPVLEKSQDSHAAKAFIEIAAKLQAQISQGKTTATAEPEKIEMGPSGDLVVKWRDGHVGLHRAYSLRLKCACAVCVDEQTRKPLLDPSKVPLDIKINKYGTVGRYAITAQFSDGHSTGIYAYDRLKQLCECPDCQKKRGVAQQEAFSV